MGLDADVIPRGGVIVVCDGGPGEAARYLGAIGAIAAILADAPGGSTGVEGGAWPVRIVRAGEEVLAAFDAGAPADMVLFDSPRASLAEGEVLARALRVGRGDPRTRVLVRGGFPSAWRLDCTTVPSPERSGAACEPTDSLRERLLPAFGAAFRELGGLERLERLERRLRATSARVLLGDLAAGVVHDLNNPLTIALVHQQRALQKLAAAEPDQVAASLVKIGDACERIQRLGLYLLDFARSRREEPRAVRAAALVESAVAACRTRFAGDEGVDFVIAVPEGLRLSVRSEEIERALAAVLENACDACKERGGKARLRVRVDAELTDSELRLRVSDDGGGVAAEEREVVFESFYTTKSAGKGAGLGLPVARLLLRDHGGDLQLSRSAPGQGAEFVLVFPPECVVAPIGPGTRGAPGTREAPGVGSVPA